VTAVTATLPIAFWAAGFALVLLPVYGTRLPGGHAISWLHWPVGLELLAGFGAGLVALLIARLLTAAFASGHVEIARALLAPSESDVLRARVATLQTSRTRVVQAADDERRRIERDLHDGAQQHLVALAMNLGRAKEKLDTDPESARILVEQAHQEAKDSITALRNVVRGVHPAVLTDRGLDAALSALAARSPVPVRLDVDVAERPSPTAEAVAYFVVSEALTNVARHAQASRVDVHVERDRERLLVAVKDDGRGGAAPSPGSGLAGLRDRLAAVDGSFLVTSAPGTGTTITAVIPCAS
jgi:signal transduction histidine kinase